MSWGEDVCATERNEEIWWICTGRNANEVLKGEANGRRSWLEWSGQLCVRALSRKSQVEARRVPIAMAWTGLLCAPLPFALYPLAPCHLKQVWQVGLASWGQSEAGKSSGALAGSTITEKARL